MASEKTPQSEPTSFPDSAPFESTVRACIEQHAASLDQLSLAIWERPELCFQEFFAVQTITAYLEQAGHRVTRNFCNLETSFLAEFQTEGFDASAQHPAIAVLLEYDALPEMGHACGHNLITEAGLAAYLAVCEALRSSNLQAKILCMGAPAEEGGGGKVKLVEAGAFRDIDFAMMVHPSPIDIVEVAILGITRLDVEFFGKAAHASCGPWEGINALDAAVAAYNNIAMLRQRLKAGNQIHIVVLNGGAKPNIIPDYTKCQYIIRAPTTAAMEILKKNVMACLKAAATATGCRLEAQFGDPQYEPLMLNGTMLSVYRHYGQKNGMFFPVMRPSYGSTDMGNVSTAIPSIHPAFAVGELHMIHTKEFQVVSGKPEALKRARRAGLTMAMTTLELIANPQLRKKARQEFEETRMGFVGNDVESSTAKGDFSNF
ncbi:peptidase M20 domain-containing protein 2-like [Paramacrobiotus metropolitanus]|uniref:peptidase M20 domain-containing protein 2-like n=1 Tax=Paramacrobiotus metropolitanus TaxID=2943436 RepID=UPI002445F621|nr:peptidase M20 domain-containing protein 2-like [Paramacrobiotus metropolitanus]